MNTTWSQFITYSCYFGLALMFASLPLSRFFMSISQFILAGVFILEGMDTQRISSYFRENKSKPGILLLVPLVIKEGFRNLVGKFRLFFRNKPALIFSSVLVIDVLGLLYTADLPNGMKVLRNNLPLFLLPLFLSSIRTVPFRTYHRFMLLFVAAVLAGTLNSTYLLLSQEITDTGHISAFIHHSRFSLMISLSVFLMTYYAIKRDIFTLPWRMAFIPVILWLLVSLFLLRSLSGIVAFFITLGILLIGYSFNASTKALRITLISLLVALLTVIGTFLYHTVTRFFRVEPVSVENLDTHTPGGGLYTHDTTLGIEDGRYIGLYICWPELQQQWDNRSLVPFDSLDMKGQQIRYTLIRYLNSKNLRKDSAGVTALTADDIYFVEHGVANINDLKRFSIRNRIHHVLLAWQHYSKGAFHPGSSAIERMEQAKAALHIIREHWLIGVGTGDVRASFRQTFTKMNSQLQSAPGGMFSSHNQFLTYLVGYGIIGLTWFLLALLYPALVNKAFHRFFFLVFFITIMVSFLADDTLNTQAGITFFAFFYSWIVFVSPQTRSLQHHNDF